MKKKIEVEKRKNYKSSEQNENLNNKQYKLKNILNNYKYFYKENLSQKHVIIFIIMLIFYFIMLNFFINSLSVIENEISNSQIISKTLFEEVIKEKLPLLAIIIFAGITPFFYLPVIGIISSYTLAYDLSYMYFMNNSISTLIIGSIGCVLQIIAISLTVATGIHYCSLSTKKFRYNERRSFGLKDVKREIYKIRKNEEKLKKMQEKESEMAQKLNVKIPYFNLLLSLIISIIIVFLGVVITKII